MSHVKKVLAFGLATILLTTVATASQASSAKPTVAPTKNPYGASSPVDPAGPNDVLLTLSNHSKTVKLSMNALRKLGTSEISIYEPFVKTRQTFTVIPLATLFKLVAVSSTATIITDALNDYIYTNTAKNFTNSRGVLAIARFGKAIPYDQGGPIRILFPDKTPLASNLNAWNWSLNVIKVK
jgi:hypothetical protein